MIAEDLLNYAVIAIMSMLTIVIGFFAAETVDGATIAHAAVQVAAEAGAYYAFPSQAGEAAQASSNAFYAKMGNVANVRCQPLNISEPVAPGGDYTVSTTCSLAAVTIDGQTLSFPAMGISASVQTSYYQ